MPEIELKHLAKRFTANIHALQSINLTIHSGELLVVLGPSGSGKSTLLKLIAGLEPADSGTVTVAGRDLSHIPPHKRDMAMVFQHPALYPHLSVYDNLAFGLRAKGLPQGQVRARVNTVAGLLSLDTLLARRPSALSGGERQRVAIGRAVAREPKVMLFDEPFSSLDLPLRSALREEVIDIHRKSGTTLIHVTHDQSEALLMGDRIAVLNEGRLLQCGTPKEIYDHPTHRMVATFVGNPPMNLLPCRLDPEGDHHVRVSPIAADHALSFVIPLATTPFLATTASTEVDLGIRPEAITLHPDPPLPPPPPPQSQSMPMPHLPSQIRRLEFQGAEAWATLSIGPHRIVARAPSDKPLHLHQQVQATLDLTRASWFDPTTGHRALP